MTTHLHHYGSVMTNIFVAVLYQPALSALRVIRDNTLISTSGISCTSGHIHSQSSSFSHLVKTPSLMGHARIMFLGDWHLIWPESTWSLFYQRSGWLGSAAVRNRMLNEAVELSTVFVNKGTVKSPGVVMSLRPRLYVWQNRMSTWNYKPLPYKYLTASESSGSQSLPGLHVLRRYCVYQRLA